MRWCGRTVRRCWAGRWTCVWILTCHRAFLDFSGCPDEKLGAPYRNGTSVSLSLIRQPRLDMILSASAKIWRHLYVDYPRR